MIVKVFQGTLHQLRYYIMQINALAIQSRLSTTRPVITLIGCNAVGRASRFSGR